MFSDQFNKLKMKMSRLENIVRDVQSDAAHTYNYWRLSFFQKKKHKPAFSGTSAHHPVVLIQGFLSSEGVLHPLEEFLRKNGRDVVTLDLGFFNVQDIRKSARLLNFKIERIMDEYFSKHDFEKIDIIGHSMGGLIGLYYVKNLGGHRIVNKLITLGTPFSGTWVAAAGLFPVGWFSRGVWQMLPTSSFIKNMQEHEERAHETEIVSIAGKYDSVIPPEACHLQGAINEVIPVGHTGLVMDEKIYKSILDFL
jgi:triacylglycerol esterase/lipase EstA (alpha/beta hydrolase family)